MSKSRRKELFEYYSYKNNQLPKNSNLFSFEYEKSTIRCFYNASPLSSEDIKNAFDQIKDITNEITIATYSPLIMIDKLDGILPDTVTSIRLEMISENEVENSIKFIKNLPKTVSTLTLCFNLNLSSTKVQALLSSIPVNIISLDIPNIFEIFKDNDEGNKQLTEIFATFPPLVQKINTAAFYSDLEESVPDSRLKKVLLQLPHSVDKLTVRKSAHYKHQMLDNHREVNMKTFRNKNYFPNYSNVASTPTDAALKTKDLLFAQAKRILSDYSKHDSICPVAARFFSGRWNLHHVDKVNEALDNSKNFEDLYRAIKEIQLDNPIGSLARRIRYIESLSGAAKRIAKIESKNNKNII